MSCNFLIWRKEIHHIYKFLRYNFARVNRDVDIKRSQLIHDSYKIDGNYFYIIIRYVKIKKENELEI